VFEEDACVCSKRMRVCVFEEDACVCVQRGCVCVCV